MRIDGVELTGPNEEILVLPRLNGSIVIRARAVSDLSEFEKMVPQPTPPGKLTKDGWIPRVDDESYQKTLEHYSTQKFAYMVLKSLVPSNIEWETVDLANPQTWKNWDSELQAAGLSAIEVNRITACVMQANALDERKLKEAREVFLRGLEEDQSVSSGHPTEPENTQSGEPATE